MIAADLGPVSLGAACEARTLLSPGGTIHLVHVLAGSGEPGGPRDVFGQGSYRELVKERLERIADDLTRDSTLRATVHVLSGDPGDAILRFARDTAPDLIAVGSHSYSLFERLLLGSVASRIVRGAHCAVLVAPCAHVPSDLRRNLIEAELLAHLDHIGPGVPHSPRYAVATPRGYTPVAVPTDAGISPGKEEPCSTESARS